MPRIGLLADFSGHYGQRGLTPFTINSLTTPGELTRVEATPDDMRQHTFLFGPEVRLLRRDPLTINVRALMGVARTNSLVLSLREPIQRPAGLQPIKQRSFPSASTFAASFGGSVDYRITDRLSYRIVQPELFLTRSGSMGTDNWNQYNFRLSTGLVFTSRRSSFGESSLREGAIQLALEGSDLVADGLILDSAGELLYGGGHMMSCFVRPPRCGRAPRCPF